ncbi:hypothetical protein [Brevibacillus choshinensis]|uniref:hypothetical protein n=1 Tax=Brevibacillus choshinensis TaxID=54911 RepID=UPI002E1CE3CD|nr:hypothetical protein [Brevibacillus choshinensis]
MSNMQLFVSNKEFDLSKVEPVINRYDRPLGGLWTSTYIPGKGSQWLQSQLCVVNPDSFGFIFDCDPAAKILDINNIPDAIEIFEDFNLGVFIPSFKNLVGEETALGVYKIDFESMARQYDAIHVSGDAVRIHKKHQGRFSPFADWNVDSTVWFNINRLKLIETLDYETLLELKSL